LADDVRVVDQWRQRDPARRKVAVVGTTFRDVPWADVLYANDMRWWRVYGDDVDRKFAGERWTVCDYRAGGVNRVIGIDLPGLSTYPGRIHTGLNSGYALVNLVTLWGVAKIVLLAYDFSRGPNGEAHHFGDHEGGLPNLGALDTWAERMNPLAADLAAKGVTVVNASRRTAITAFKCAPLREALKPSPVVRFAGMHGLGDNLHQRALMREQLASGKEVWLETPWPSVYHDLPVNLLPKQSILRTQGKNVEREWARYTKAREPYGITPLRIWYSHDQIRREGSFLQAMAVASIHRRVDPAAFRLPIPERWEEDFERDIAPSLSRTKPWLLYRPLVERTEWPGCAARNPDRVAYAALAKSLSVRFSVVSVADLEPGREWVTSDPVGAEVEFHAGELSFEMLAVLASRSLVFASPGFALVLAQAVDTHLIAVFGGFEAPRFYSYGDPKQLLIGPKTPCECFSKTHNCAKGIDIPAALERIEGFIHARSTANDSPLRLDGRPRRRASRVPPTVLQPA
jgi:hypothetical protein